ncbi:MAG: ABC transporter permease [Puniceicoccales bacterium]|jgi:ABC-type transport system involved in multi-copper enzyme maturation permease subunit|nr:ABC transporter permease [Puniceicoccales bacterium]
MECFFALLAYEWRRIFRRPGFFFIGFFFLFFAGLLFWSVLASYVGQAQTVGPFTLWLRQSWPLLLLSIPSLTADSIAGERSAGTLDGLLCGSAPPAAILLAKFFTLLFCYLLLWVVAIALQPLAFRLAAFRLPFPLWSDMELLNAFSVLTLSGALYLSCWLFFSTVARTQAQVMVATLASLFGLLFGPPVLLKFLPADRWPLLEDFFARLGAASPIGWTNRFWDLGTAAIYLIATATVLCLTVAFVRPRLSP